MTWLFYIAAVVAVIATILVITRHNLVHALLYLVVSLFAVAVVFYTLGAPFVAALEVIVYAGAIMMLFLFAVMLLNLRADEAARVPARYWAGPGILAAVLLVELIYGVGAADHTLQHGRRRAAGREPVALRPLRARRRARLDAAAGGAHRRAPHRRAARRDAARPATGRARRATARAARRRRARAPARRRRRPRGRSLQR